MGHVNEECILRLLLSVIWIYLTHLLHSPYKFYWRKVFVHLILAAVNQRETELTVVNKVTKTEWFVTRKPCGTHLLLNAIWIRECKVEKHLSSWLRCRFQLQRVKWSRDLWSGGTSEQCHLWHATDRTALPLYCSTAAQHCCCRKSAIMVGKSLPKGISAISALSS